MHSLWQQPVAQSLLALLGCEKALNVRGAMAGCIVPSWFLQISTKGTGLPVAYRVSWWDLGPLVILSMRSTEGARALNDSLETCNLT